MCHKKIKSKRMTILLIYAYLLLSMEFAYAYETAPRISDKEIIESLTELKQGQKNMNQTFNQRIEDMTQRFNKRFEDMNRRLEDMNQSFNQRLEDMNQSFNQRFEDMSRRFEDMHNLILTLFASVMALVVALIGYMIWDRKTAQLPLKLRLGKLENEFKDIEVQLETKNPSGPVIARLLASFRKLAETDEKVAAILRTYSLL